MKKFGDLIYEQRISLGFTLKTFCLKNIINPTILSKIERNIQIPRSGELTMLIEALKIYEGSAEHSELLDAYSNFEPVSNDITTKDLPVFLKEGVDIEKLIDLLKESDSPEEKPLFKESE